MSGTGREGVATESDRKPRREQYRGEAAVTNRGQTCRLSERRSARRKEQERSEHTCQQRRRKDMTAKNVAAVRAATATETEWETVGGSEHTETEQDRPRCDRGC